MEQFYKDIHDIYVNNRDYHCERSLLWRCAKEWQNEKIKLNKKRKLDELPKKILKYDPDKHIMIACPEELKSDK